MACVAARFAIAIVPLSLAALASACTKTTDEGDCRKLVAKAAELLARGAPSAEPAEKVRSAVESDPRALAISRESCVGKITKGQYDCMIAASSFEAFVACDDR